MKQFENFRIVFILQTLGREDGAPMDWIIEEPIGNWWRPNFEPPQVNTLYCYKNISMSKNYYEILIY